jgi:hypothetical protein
MRRSTAASFVVVAFALSVVAGCGKSEGAVASKPDPEATKAQAPTPGHRTTPGNPPGLVKGVVQIHKTSGGGSQLVACFCRDDENKVIWAVNQSIGFPILGQAGETFTYTCIDANLVDTAPHDGTVSEQEFFSYVQSIQPGGSTLTEHWQVTETIVDME